MRTAPLLIVVALVLLSCKSTADIDDPDFAQFVDPEFPDPIRLTNGNVNLIVVPSFGGRIMRYGFVGGPNLLWNNPDARPPDPHVVADATTQPKNMNYGGDKAWPWPQDQWPLLIGRTYPPPEEADQQPYKSRRIGSHTVRLESPPIPSHRARIVREITLAPVGTRVKIVTRLEPVAGSDRPPPELAAWSVTQIPGNAKLYARMIPDGVTKPMNLGASTMPPTTKPVVDAVVAVIPPTPRAGKLGIDADVLAAASGPALFVQRSPTAATNSHGYRRTERAQIFCQQADVKEKERNRSGVVPRYLELEFTSPRQDLASGRVAELVVTWDIQEAAEPSWTDKAVAAFLLADTPEPANLLPAPGVP